MRRRQMCAGLVAAASGCAAPNLWRTAPTSPPEVPDTVESEALAALVARAASARSDALWISHRGRVVADERFDTSDEPIETMSMTKSIASLAVGLLVDDTVIASIDEPAHRWFPQWADTDKAAITVRHILGHATGLALIEDTQDIYAEPDFVALALGSALTDPPGERIVYNNNSANLVPGLVARAAGKPIDALLAERVFDPLGIPDHAWLRDSAGNPHGMSGLGMRAAGLGAIGQLLLDRGQTKDRRILSEAWIDTATRPASERYAPFGAFWWLRHRLTIAIDEAVVAAWTRGGADPQFIAKLRPLVGRSFEGAALGKALEQALGPTWQEQWNANTWKMGLPDGTMTDRTLEALYGSGWLGQYLVVVPGREIVAVRQRRLARGEDPAGVDSMDDFIDRVLAL